MGSWNPRKPNAGRSGARWRACRQAVLERDAGICRWCGHAGAGEADHYPMSISELRAERLDPDDPQHSVASHGVTGPCQTCGCTANQNRNGRNWTAPVEATCAYASSNPAWHASCNLEHSRDWFAA